MIKELITQGSVDALNAAEIGDIIEITSTFTNKKTYNLELLLLSKWNDVETKELLFKCSSGIIIKVANGFPMIETNNLVSSSVNSNSIKIYRFVNKPTVGLMLN